MKRKAKPVPVAADIESRQDQILQLLDELNNRIEQALTELGVPVSVQCEAVLASQQRVAEAA